MIKSQNKNSANKRLVKFQIAKHINNLKCKKCRFRNKLRNEWCFYHDRKLLDVFSRCNIDPDNITQKEIQLMKKRKCKNRSAS